MGGSKILVEAGKQENLTTNVPKILDLKSSSEQIFSKNRRGSWMPLSNIQEYATKRDKDPTAENLNNLEILQTDYDRQYDYIAQGGIITKITSELV